MVLTANMFLWCVVATAYLQKMSLKEERERTHMRARPMARTPEELMPSMNLATHITQYLSASIRRSWERVKATRESISGSWRFLKRSE